MQGGERAAVRALQARADAATRWLWQPKTHLFTGEYLNGHELAPLASERIEYRNFMMPTSNGMSD